MYLVPPSFLLSNDIDSTPFYTVPLSATAWRLAPDAVVSNQLPSYYFDGGEDRGRCGIKRRKAAGSARRRAPSVPCLADLQATPRATEARYFTGEPRRCR